jgi:hypothetical protein
MGNISFNIAKMPIAASLFNGSEKYLRRMTSGNTNDLRLDKQLYSSAERTNAAVAFLGGAVSEIKSSSGSVQGRTGLGGFSEGSLNCTSTIIFWSEP